MCGLDRQMKGSQAVKSKCSSL